MELLRGRVFFVSLLCFLSMGCAKKFKPVVSIAEPLITEQNLGQNFLDGVFVLENGSMQLLSNLNDKPILIFFVGEFCGACRQEATHLKEVISIKGLPTKIHLVSVMIEVDPGVATDWLTGISPTSSLWLLGSDPQLSLYFRYFQQLVTPSIIFFDPQTQILKRWQTVVPLQTLEQETVSWY